MYHFITTERLLAKRNEHSNFCLLIMLIDSISVKMRKNTIEMLENVHLLSEINVWTLSKTPVEVEKPLLASRATQLRRDFGSVLCCF